LLIVILGEEAYNKNMKSINKVIKILILSDVALITGFGFIGPIFAIFLTEKIQGSSIEVVGYAAAIYWIVQSLVVIPFGKYLDRNHGEKDDIWFIVIGNLLAAFVVFMYIFSYLPWHIYCLQALYAIGMGMNIPGYTAIFTRHIDKGREAFDWSVRSCLMGIGSGVTGALGGIIASRFGFDILFVGVGIFVLLSAFLPFMIFKNISPKNKEIVRDKMSKGIQPPILKE